MNALRLWIMVGLLLMGRFDAVAQTHNLDTDIGSTPAEPVGKKTERGLTITSTRDGFAIDLPGQRIQPLSSDRLVWEIDDLRVELSIARRPASTIAPWSADSALHDIEARTQAREEESIDVPGKPARRIWTAPDSTLGAGILPTGVVILRAAAKSAAAQVNARKYIKASLDTLRAVAHTSGESSLSFDPRQGGSLREQVLLPETLTGVPYVAFLNSKLASSADRNLRGTLPLPPQSIADFARWLLGLGTVGFTVNVFDGHVAHAINLVGYDFAQEAFEYTDPWGKGSFLEKGNNAADVGATPHASKPRVWVIRFGELEGVLYAGILQEREMLDAIRICTLSASAPQAVFDSYRAAATNPDKKERVSPATLEAYAHELYRVARPKAAEAILAVRVLADPAPVPPDLIALARKNGTENLTLRAQVFLQGSELTTAKRALPRLTLDGAMAREFFKFFGLSLESKDNGIANFRPKAAQFHSLAQVLLNIDKEGIVSKKEMVLKRSFIDDPAAGMFANDFAKSFIAFAATDADAPAVQPLVTEIYEGRSSNVPIPGAIHSTASIPAMPSPGVFVYRGGQSAYQMLLPTSVLEMRNSGAADASELRISVTPR